MLLSGILSIDATDRLGWLAGRILADLGADVIKIDPPGTDRNRPQWRAFNVNRRVVDLDDKAPADLAALEQLLAKADICLLTPATSDFGVALEADALRAKYPRLVVVTMTPFGRRGPRRGWRASDL